VKISRAPREIEIFAGRLELINGYQTGSQSATKKAPTDQL
jgi:hypothetical protein